MSTVPYGESSGFVKGFHSPYYTESHKKFRLAVRKFVSEKVYKDKLDPTIQ